MYQLGGQRALRQGLHGVRAPAGRLAAQMAGAGADNSHAHRFFQRQSRVSAPTADGRPAGTAACTVRCPASAQTGIPAPEARGNSSVFVSFSGAAAGDGYAEKQPDQHPVVELDPAPTGMSDQINVLMRPSRKTAGPDSPLQLAVQQAGHGHVMAAEGDDPGGGELFGLEHIDDVETGGPA